MDCLGPRYENPMSRAVVGHIWSFSGTVSTVAMGKKYMTMTKVNGTVRPSSVRPSSPSILPPSVRPCCPSVPVCRTARCASPGCAAWNVREKSWGFPHFCADWQQSLHSPTDLEIARSCGCSSEEHCTAPAGAVHWFH